MTRNDFPGTPTLTGGKVGPGLPAAARSATWIAFATDSHRDPGVRENKTQVAAQRAANFAGHIPPGRVGIAPPASRRPAPSVPSSWHLPDSWPGEPMPSHPNRSALYSLAHRTLSPRRLSGWAKAGRVIRPAMSARQSGSACRRRHPRRWRKRWMARFSPLPQEDPAGTKTRRCCLWLWFCLVRSCFPAGSSRIGAYRHRRERLFNWRQYRPNAWHQYLPHSAVWSSNAAASAQSPGRHNAIGATQSHDFTAYNRQA